MPFSSLHANGKSYKSKDGNKEIRQLKKKKETSIDLDGHTHVCMRCAIRVRVCVRAMVY